MTATIDSAQAFALLYDQLKSFHNGLYDGGYRVVGSLLLIVGWIITSEKARAALRSSAALRRSGGASVIACSIGYGLLTILLQRKSEATARLLDALHYAPREYYESQIITMEAALLVGGIVIVIAALAAFMVSRPPTDGG